MMALSRDTIFSLSSAPGRAGVSVFRVSGEASGKVLDSLIKKARPVSYTHLTLPTILLV